MTKTSRAMFVIGAVCGAMLLSACTTPMPQFADLEREQVVGDELPSLGEGAYKLVDEESSRFVGEHNGSLVWIAKGKTDGAVCLIVDGADDVWGVGCGGGLGVSVGGLAGSFTAVGDGFAAPTGKIKISENVYGRG